VVKRFFLLFILSVTIVSTIIYYYSDKDIGDKDIILGSSLPLSGINKELGEEIKEGANTYFNHINTKGGIKGKHINLICYDDKYEPQNTLVNIDRLINIDKVFALFGFVGTPTTQIIMPIVKDTHIPFIAPYTGASFLRNPQIPNIVNFRSSYKEEIEAIVENLYKKKHIRKFSIFYQNDDYGEEGYVATVEALSKRDLKLVSEGTYKRNTLSIRHALNEIKANTPEAIIIVGAYKPSAQFIKKARECCFKNVIFAPISFVNSNALIGELDGDGKNILFSQTVPSYHDKSLNEVEQYLRLLKFYYPQTKPTYASFESFLAAKTVVNALENINGDITRKRFLMQIKNLNQNTFKDIYIKYKNTQLLNKVFLSTYKNNQFKPIKKTH